MACVLTETLIRTLAGTEAVLAEGRGLVRKGAFRALARTADGTMAFGDCQGSDPRPYTVLVDVSVGAQPVTWCSCPSRRVPCKHAVALMLAFAARGGDFKVGEPAAETLAQRDRAAERASRPAVEPRPRAVNKQALARKQATQRDALETLETFLLDLVTRGLGGMDRAGRMAVTQQAARMADVELPGPRYLLLRVAALASPRRDTATGDGTGHGPGENHGEVDPDGGAYREDVPGVAALEALALPAETRRALLASTVTQLWTLVRRGRKMLDGRLEEGESTPEDASVETVLGRRWQLTELKDLRYWTKERTLVELAHERREDAIGEVVVTTGWLLDLDDGAVHYERSILPYSALRAADVRHRVSREGVFTVSEAAVYPGEGINRRIRWSDREEGVTERPRTPADGARMDTLARPLEVALRAFREHLRNPLAEHHGVVWLAAARFGMVHGVTVMEDAAGGRLAFGDPPETEHRTTANLHRAAVAYGRGSVAVRLWYDLRARGVVGQALALLADGRHVRLGL